MVIRIKTGNAAFQDADSIRPQAVECARILRDLAGKLEIGQFPRVLMDLNGNAAGSVHFTQ